MLESEFVAEMARLKAMLPPVRDEHDANRRAAIAEEVKREFSSTPTARFRDVVAQVIRTYKHGIPTVADFRAALAEVKKARGSAPSPDCHSCGGIGMLYVRVVRFEKKYDACVPCEQCRGVRVTMPPEVAIVDDGRTWMQREAESMSPRAAQIAIEKADQSGVPFPPEIIATLTERAAAAESEAAHA